MTTLICVIYSNTIIPQINNTIIPQIDMND